MKQVNRQKLLGQYFSGKRIADALFDLLGKPKNQTVIDPMCGQGDLLIPFCKHNSIYGIELDPIAYHKATTSLKCANIFLGNAFDLNILNQTIYEGYDVVITNPPYIRRENYKKAGTEIEGCLAMDIVRRNLLQFITRIGTITSEEKEQVTLFLKNMSGFTDIATLSWLLCILLTKLNGYLAIVVPNTWLGREYSIPIVSLFKKLFAIEYIINDANSVWFENVAQVQTSLVVAKRVLKCSFNQKICFIDIFKNAVSEKTISVFVPIGQSLKEYVSICKPYMKGMYEKKDILQADFVSNSLSLSITSKLNTLNIKSCKYQTLEDLGVSCGQGFRSGANAFFIFNIQNKHLVSKIGKISVEYKKDFFIPIIQNQKNLGSTYTVDTDENQFQLLLIEANNATASDVGKLSIDKQLRFNIIPNEIEDYIIQAECYRVKERKIPELTAVRTNVRNKGNDIRFWYNIPNFTKRHKGIIFIPRVNSSTIIARLNPHKYIVDANFITFWIKSKTFYDENGILAFINSSWFSILCEENGIVMGGGALKLDAAQLRKIPLPLLSIRGIQALNEIGKRLRTVSIDMSANLIREIDSIILSELGVDCKIALQMLEDIKKDYINRRVR